MPYLDDDFQGYTVGTVLPFGSFIGSGNTKAIEAFTGGTGVAGTDRCFHLDLGLAEYVRGYLTTFTQYIALYYETTITQQLFYSVTNGPNGFGQSFTLLQLRIESDGTLTAVCPVTSEILGNSGDFFFDFYTWNFFQVNVTFSDVTVLGIDYVHIHCDVVLNGQTILSFNVTTGATIAALDGATSQVNHFQLLGGRYGAFTLDTLQAVPSYPHAGSPEAMVHQSVVEADALVDSGELEAIQSGVEVDVLPDSAELVAIQMVVEVDVLVADRWYISES